MQSGDIFGQPDGVMGWFSRNLLSPKNECIHYGLILFYWEAINDWLVLESIGHKGVHIAALGDRKVKIYHVVGISDEDRQKAIRESFGLCGAWYDWKLIAKLILKGTPKLIVKRRRLSAKELSGGYKQDEQYICTEAALAGYAKAGIHIVPKGILPLPSSIKEAELQGKIVRVGRL